MFMASKNLFNKPFGSLRYAVSLAMLSGVLLCGVQQASAVPLSDATEVRSGFNFPNGAVNGSSYDGPGFDAFSSFASFTSPDLLKVNSFTGQPAGSQLEFTLLSEAAAFDGTTTGYANRFGVINSQGDFTSVIDTAAASAGATGTLGQGAGESFKFALQSPEGLFTTEDSQNVDGAAHILAMKVNKSGDFTVDPTSLHGTSPLTFSFLEGDLILFIEDMKAIGNLTSFLVPESGDFDYNDMVVVVRQSSQVPEPATCLLLGSALLGAAGSRKRKVTAA
jgi:hypothetical protein